MNTTPTSFFTNLDLTHEGVLASALDCLQNHVSIDMQGVCSLKTLFVVLLRAASRADSIEQTAQRLTGVPTGKAIHIIEFVEIIMDSLETQLNEALYHQLPSTAINHRHKPSTCIRLLCLRSFVVRQAAHANSAGSEPVTGRPIG